MHNKTQFKFYGSTHDNSGISYYLGSISAPLDTDKETLVSYAETLGGPELCHTLSVVFNDTLLTLR